MGPVISREAHSLGPGKTTGCEEITAVVLAVEVEMNAARGFAGVHVVPVAGGRLSRARMTSDSQRDFPTVRGFASTENQRFCPHRLGHSFAVVGMLGQILKDLVGGRAFTPLMNEAIVALAPSVARHCQATHGVVLNGTPLVMIGKLQMMRANRHTTVFTGSHIAKTGNRLLKIAMRLQVRKSRKSRMLVKRHLPDLFWIPLMMLRHS